MLYMAPQSLLIKYFESESYVVMPCCIFTYRAYYVYVIEMLWYVWDPTPSCLFLVAYFMGKCLLVLPLSLGSLLLLRKTWIDRHVSFFAPMSALRGMSRDDYRSPVSIATARIHSYVDRHGHCWVMYACFHN